MNTAMERQMPTTSKPAAHTPGPWSLCYDGQIDGPNGETICRFTWDNFRDFNNSPSEKANARLIAAAPELLAMLKELLADSDDVDDGKLPTISAATVVRARSVIAKAGAA